jgi:hypothetical protein
MIEVGSVGSFAVARQELKKVVLSGNRCFGIDCAVRDPV